MRASNRVLVVGLGFRIQVSGLLQEDAQKTMKKKKKKKEPTKGENHDKKAKKENRNGPMPDNALLLARPKRKAEPRAVV
jgi:hypothetical protein